MTPSPASPRSVRRSHEQGQAMKNEIRLQTDSGLFTASFPANGKLSDMRRFIFILIKTMVFGRLRP